MRPATRVVARAVTWPLAPALVVAMTLLLLRRLDAAGAGDPDLTSEPWS